MRLPAAFFCLFLVRGVAAGAEPPASPSPPVSAPAGVDDLYQAGQQLFDQWAPPEIKQRYDFPSKDQIADFLAGLQRTLDRGSFEDLAAYRPQATTLLAVLRSVPDYADDADWLAARLEEIDAAGDIARASGSSPLPPAPGAAGPGPRGQPKAEGIPYYDVWLRREHGRAPPANAADLMPRLRRAFAAEGVPPEVAWLAEVESSLNPSAHSPSGARGLFQLKADTAHDLGLKTFLPDDRTDPEKSARAAARYLRTLRNKFGSWPLAFAAYNAGEGRVGRALAARRADDFAGVAEALPAETRMYVPEVCAVVAVRTGMKPDEIPAPR